MIEKLWYGFLDCVFPRLCVGCDRKLVQGEVLICTICYNAFPETNFHTLPSNPVTDRFLGKTTLSYGYALYRLRKRSLLEKVLHAMKYRGKSDIAKLFGIGYGHTLHNTLVTKGLDYIIPLSSYLPNHFTSDQFAQGLSHALQIPIYKNSTNRSNKDDAFNPYLRGKNILLVSDVLFQGLTLSRYAKHLLRQGVRSISIATIAIAENIETLTVDY